MTDCPHADFCVKRWNGSDRRCAFTNPDEEFSASNWNCGVVNLIRDLVSEDNRPHRDEVNFQYLDDNKYATVNVDEVDDLGAQALWVTWYKSRGTTMGMWLLDNYDDPRRPTRSDLLKIARHFGLSRDGEVPHALS